MKAIRTFFGAAFLVSISIMAKPSTVIAGELDGVWASSCQNGFKTRITFQGRRWTTEKIFFSDASCSAMSMREVASGSFQLAHDPGKANSYDIANTNEQLLLISEDDKGTKDFNQTAYCNFRDWKKGVAKDITNSGCTGPFPVGQVSMRGKIEKVLQPELHLLLKIVGPDGQLFSGTKLVQEN